MLMIEHINKLQNHFNYYEYIGYCLENNIAPLTFVGFAQVVQTEILDKNLEQVKDIIFKPNKQVVISTEPPDMSAQLKPYNTPIPTPCGSCGGGTVR